MEDFKKEITFLSKQFIDGEWVLVETTKTARFKDLSRVDRDQHKLHFMIMKLFNQSETEEGDEDKMNIDSDALYDLTVKAIRKLLIVDADFSEQDKVELLNDSGAILNFSLWALKEKFTPFFSTLRMI